MKETKKLHWTKRNKILEKFVRNRKQTIPQIALECLLMGIEDIENSRRDGSICISFESLEGVPIGYRAIFKERVQRDIEREVRYHAQQTSEEEEKHPKST